MSRAFRNVSFLVLALALMTVGTSAHRRGDACLAGFGGNSPENGTSQQAMSACQSNGSSNCNLWCWNDFGTGSDGTMYGCITSNYDSGTWYSYGNCSCVCPI